jgi:hypothetical protein
MTGLLIISALIILLFRFDSTARHESNRFQR